MKNTLFVLGMSALVAAFVFVPGVSNAQSEVDSSSFIAQLSSIVSSLREAVASIAASIGSAVMSPENEPYDAALLALAADPTDPVIANRHPIITELRTLSKLNVGQDVSVRVGSWDPNGNEYNVHVSWGDEVPDGPTSNGVAISATTTPKVVYRTFKHRYQKAGDYKVKAWVEDLKVVSFGRVGLGGEAATEMTVPITGTATSTTGTPKMVLSLVSGQGASPSQDQIKTAGEGGSVYLVFKLSAMNEAQKLSLLTVKARPSVAGKLQANDLSNIRLYRQVGSQSVETTAFASANRLLCYDTSECSYTFQAPVSNLLPDPVNPGTPVTVYLKADVAAGGDVNLGDNFVFSVSGVTTLGVSSGKTGQISGVPSTVQGRTHLTPFTVQVLGEYPTTSVTIGTGSGGVVGRFKIKNHGWAPITFRRFQVVNAGSYSGTFDVYRSKEKGEPNDTTEPLALGYPGQGDYSTVVSVPIDKGSWIYITVKNAVAATNNDTIQLSVNALGQIRYSVSESDLGYSGNPSVDSDISDVISDLFADGKPGLAVVTMKD